jgi:hypothetical protein
MGRGRRNTGFGLAIMGEWARERNRLAAAGCGMASLYFPSHYQLPSLSFAGIARPVGPSRPPNLLQNNSPKP